ncbi:hypothetical protein GQE99_04210 [Maritimibacter sp. DP07]|uniref:Uncharacterized protein n=1 Tax=Maritimibacter harenae TaxID=2606218 RepID=A0A845LXW8_9RHOB|nr:hypothetical protein [Maritimibacter harenae]MZR12216.1 hypothetical protein [Maritimibacter harenae]
MNYSVAEQGGDQGAVATVDELGWRGEPADLLISGTGACSSPRLPLYGILIIWTWGGIPWVALPAADPPGQPRLSIKMTGAASPPDRTGTGHLEHEP